MQDMMELSSRGFRQKLCTYLIMTVLVAFTVAGYLVVTSYWRDAAAVSTATAQPLDFPYAKATVLFAYWTNPPMTADEEFPPPRKYAPVWNDDHLGEIRKIPDILGLSVALEQNAFSRFGSGTLLSLEAGAPMWQDLDLISGSLPQNPSQVLVPSDFVDAGAKIGQELTVKVAEGIMPRLYRKDSTLVDSPDPAPLKRLTVTGVYEPASIMISGLIGYIPVNRVDDYPTTDPKKVTMDWPVPNTVFLHLANPARAGVVLSNWRGLYPEFPGADPPLIPPVKVEWTPDLPELMVLQAVREIATPVSTNTAGAFGLGAIGIFASMFVSFLDRRKDLGIMKTLGIDNSRTAATVSLETVFAGILGTVFGILAATAVTRFYLKGVSGNLISIPWSVILAGGAVSSSILIAATYVPRMMARQGTVMELLHGRAIPIYRQKVQS